MSALSCAVCDVSLAGVLYAWYKDDFFNFIRPELKPYIMISHDGRLYFSEVTSDDIGEYAGGEGPLYGCLQVLLHRVQAGAGHGGGQGQHADEAERRRRK